jgi:competence protein ComFC
VIFEQLYNFIINTYPLIISGNCSIILPKTKNKLEVIYCNNTLELNFYDEQLELFYSENSFGSGEDNYNISWSDDENFIALTYISQWYEDLYFIDISKRKIIYEISGENMLDGSRAVAFLGNKALILPTLNSESGISDLKVLDCNTLKETILLKSEFASLYELVCENFCIIDNILVFYTLQVSPGNIFTGTPDVVSNQKIKLIDMQELVNLHRLKIYSYDNHEIEYVLKNFQINHIMKSKNDKLLISYDNQIIEYNLNINFNNYRIIELLEPIVLNGGWDKGYAMDLHTTSSHFISDGTYNTTRSKIGELLYQFKYMNNYGVLDDMSLTIIDFASKVFSGYGLGSWIDWSSEIDVIIPIPPTNHNRNYQPVAELTKKISEFSNIKCDLDYLQKRSHAELKGIDNDDERRDILKNAFYIPNQKYKGKNILLLDDIFRSGTTLDTATQILKEKAGVGYIYVLTITKTRTKR